MLSLLCCGCVEVSSSTRSASFLIGGAEIIEHTYLWGNDGPFTKTYDVKVTILGAEVANATGISRQQMESLLANYK